MALEEIGGRRPGEILAVAMDIAAIEAQGAGDGLAKIAIDRAGHAFGHDIDRAWDGEGGDRGAASHGLDHHQAEGVGAARKDEDIGALQHAHEIAVEGIAGEDGCG